MAGRHKWSEVEAIAAPETVLAAEAKAERTLASLRLGQLRKARGLTQETIADRLEIRQVSVSRLEARDDVRVSTLRSVVEAMGGEMEIRANFADAAYRISFSDEEAVIAQVGRSGIEAIGDYVGHVVSTLSAIKAPESAPIIVFRQRTARNAEPIIHVEGGGGFAPSARAVA